MIFFLRNYVFKRILTVFNLEKQTCAIIQYNIYILLLSINIKIPYKNIYLTNSFCSRAVVKRIIMNYNYYICI